MLSTSKPKHVKLLNYQNRECSTQNQFSLFVSVITQRQLENKLGMEQTILIQALNNSIVLDFAP